MSLAAPQRLLCKLLWAAVSATFVPAALLLLLYSQHDNKFPPRQQHLSALGSISQPSCALLYSLLTVNRNISL